MKEFQGNAQLSRSFLSFAPVSASTAAEQAAATRERILHTAMELFLRYGIRAITMDELASRIGVSKKTIYQHFADKNTLVKATTEQHFCEEREFSVRIQRESRNPVEALIHVILHVNEKLTGIQPGLFYELRKYYPEAYASFDNFRCVDIVNLMRHNLQQGLREGYYRQDIDPDVILHYYAHLPELLLNPEAFPPTQFRTAHVYKEITLNFLHGLVTQKGRAIIQHYKADLRR